MARNKNAQGGISLRRKVTAWLAAILLVTMLSTGIATMAGQWTVRSFDMLLADNAAVCPPMIYAGPQLNEIQIEGRAVGFCRGL